MNRTIQFLKYKWFAIGFSVILFVGFSIGTVINGGFTMGIDFVGGVKIIIDVEKGVDEAQLRKVLHSFSPSVQKIGQDTRNEYIISIKLSGKKEITSEQIEKMKATLKQHFKYVEFLSVENVGPAIGDYLKGNALKLILLSIIFMSLYLSFRFEFKFAAGAMIALIHDIAISVIFCGFAGVEINIPVIAAYLTIFGYSVNDTIVIFDRIRETINSKVKLPLVDIINVSITQTLTRSLLTVLTTLFAVVALYVLGGEGINEFALVLLVGLTIGTYSSIYIASPVVLFWDNFFSKKKSA